MLNEEPKKMLSEFISKEDDTECLEDIVWGKEVIIDEGFYIEVYINIDGVYGDEDGEHSSNGYSLFRYINKEISYEDFLNLDLFNEGSLRDSTMTIHVIPSTDKAYEDERNMCVNLFN